MICCADFVIGWLMRQILVFAGLVLAVGAGAARYADVAAPRSSLVPGAAAKVEPPPPIGGTVSIARDEQGHFRADGRVDGRHVMFMVDTGASVVALRESDAASFGLHPSRRDFTAQVNTANGVVHGAPASLNMVEVGGLLVRDVKALVLPDEALGENLLGMSFLARLRHWEFVNGKLVLEQ